MIVISNPISLQNEIEIIHALFEEGLELFHLRKPNFSEQEMRIFISKIHSKYHAQMVLHQQHELAEEFEINRIHFSEKNRVEMFNTLAKFSKPCMSYSTSVHSIGGFNELSNVFDYAFLSPIYPSISKENYFSEKDVFEEIKKRTNQHTKLIALGGISAENTANTLNNGFNDIGLLGTIWNNENPIKEFKKCQEIVHSL